MTGTYHENERMFLVIVSHSIRLRMGHVSDQVVRKVLRTTDFMFHNVFFSRKSFVYEIIWKNIQPGSHR
jgi:hypothetical protein